jgi:hypothetical protein
MVSVWVSYSRTTPTGVRTEVSPAVATIVALSGPSTVPTLVSAVTDTCAVPPAGTVISLVPRVKVSSVSIESASVTSVVEELW